MLSSDAVYLFYSAHYNYTTIIKKQSETRNAMCSDKKLFDYSWRPTELRFRLRYRKCEMFSFSASFRPRPKTETVFFGFRPEMISCFDMNRKKYAHRQQMTGLVM